MNWTLYLRLARRADWVQVMTLLALTVLGVFFIYSAGYQREDIPVTEFYQRQIIWVLVGLVVYGFFAVTDYRRFLDAAWWLFLLALVLLVLVLFVGKRVYGATRWLSFFQLQVQPSELGKLAVLLVLARYLGTPGRDTSDPFCTLKSLAIISLPFLLIARQPDLGTAMTLVPIALATLFVARVPVRYLALLALFGVLCLPVVWFTLGDYQQDRIMVFVDPGRDPLGAGWNKIQSAIAVGSGGLTGKGYLKGTQNILGYLPRTVAPTDFIYSVIAEEMGFVGSAVVLSLYAMLLIAACRTALVARDQTGRLLAVGVVSMIFFHVFVNIAMTIGLMPVTGLPLPLISYGGSFMVSTMAGLGMVQSVYIRRYRR